MMTKPSPLDVLVSVLHFPTPVHINDPWWLSPPLPLEHSKLVLLDEYVPPDQQGEPLLRTLTRHLVS